MVPDDVNFEKQSLFFNKTYSSIHLFKSKNIDLEAKSDLNTEYDNVSAVADDFNHYNKLDC